ncbi:hypothetical protein [Alteriqipengyuania lutimaris]|uniref:hypothetical protein n=1 Tax=Alteriqipengyuania lutimaris TaxID=1538146 RepID=UPI001CFD5F36|nr:hypothetical protein [Alteriqipengyuania lutimaris]
MNTLRISVDPSLETNDHQARLLVDQKDWLGKDSAGLDPPMLRNQLSSRENKIIVGRCACGSVGCDDVLVELVRENGLVKWQIDGGETLVFDANAYDVEVDRFSRDKSWETTERAAEREINSILRDTNLKHGFKFEWASARIREGFIILSYGKPAKNRDHQRLLEFEWDGASVASAIDGAIAFRARRFPHLP